MSKQKSSEKDIIASLDRLPAREEIYENLQKKFGSLAEYYGFELIFTPPIEHYRQYLPLIRGGYMDERIPVQCRCRPGSDYVLRVSGILSALRAYISHKMSDGPQPVKLVFEGDVFFAESKREDAIKSRYECGLLIAGEEGPVAAAEIVQIFWKILDGIGVDLRELELRVNAIGCASCYPSFRSSLASYFRSRASRLCRSCRKAAKSHPVRALSCADEKCKMFAKHAPQVLDFLCDQCKKQLRGFLEFLDELKVPYYLDPRFFRDGLWFNTLIFEFSGKAKEKPVSAVAVEGGGAEDVAGGDNNDVSAEEHEGAIVIGEGGGCTKAAELLSGKRVEAVGFELYIDRLIMFLSRRRLVDSKKPMVFLTHLGDLAKRKSLALMETLRGGGIEVKESLGRDSIKSQLKLAEKAEAKFALIMGQKEALDDTIIVREVGSGIQETIPQEKLIEFLKAKLKK
ncbi:MAG: ATP phosphoribosyltransferase regulatory subunit [Candidatus Sungbacteria bacterium]|nr:ATP phosphoribosyltransferase regulatory subunit [Candidatus Sungbacteria bacterium]